MNDAPSVAVVLLTFNGVRFLDALISSILEQTVVPSRVIVVDNASRDGTVDRIRAMLGDVAQIIVNDNNYGCARGWNIGARLCRDCDIICFLNQDIVLDRDYCAAVVRRFAADPSLTALQPLVRQLQNPDVVDNCGHTVDAWMTTRTINRFLPIASLSPVPQGLMFTLTAPAIRRTSFEALGGFDEDLFIYYEDTDLALRIWASGGRVAFEPAVVVYHFGEGSSGLFPDRWRTYLWTRNRLQLLWKYAQGPAGFSRAAIVTLVALGGVACLLPMRPRDALAIARALGWNLCHARSIRTRRSAIRGMQYSIDDLRRDGILRASEGILPLTRRGLKLPGDPDWTSPQPR